MNNLPDDTVSPPAIVERPAGIWYMVRNVLIAILKIFELFQVTFTSIRILSEPSGRSVSVIAGSNPPGGMDVCFECSVLPGRGLCVGPITRRPWPRGGCCAMGKRSIFFRVKNEEF